MSIYVQLSTVKEKYFQDSTYLSQWLAWDFSLSLTSVKHMLNFRKAGSIREASSNIAFRIKYMFKHFSKKVGPVGPYWYF